MIDFVIERFFCYVFIIFVIVYLIEKWILILCFVFFTFFLRKVKIHQIAVIYLYIIPP